MASFEDHLDIRDLDEVVHVHGVTEDGPSLVILDVLHTCHAGGVEIKQAFRPGFYFVSFLLDEG